MALFIIQASETGQEWTVSLVLKLMNYDGRGLIIIYASWSSSETKKELKGSFEDDPAWNSDQFLCAKHDDAKLN